MICNVCNLWKHRDIYIHKMWDIIIMHDKQRTGKMKGMNFNKKE